MERFLPTTEYQSGHSGLPVSLAKNTRGLNLIVAISLALLLSACGGSSSSNSSAPGPQVAGNWQFTMTTTGTSFNSNSSPLNGGFLLQKNGVITGQINYSIVLPPTSGGSPVICNSGTADVTGTMSGQSVTLTAVVGTLDQNGKSAQQTFTLKEGALSADGSTIQQGKYTVTAGYALDLNNQLIPCGTAQDAGTWTALSVPPLTGGFQGFFHSTVGTVENQNIAVSGTFTQGPNSGASSATVTGTLLFQDPVTLLNDYPCLSTASVNGTISGETVLLQIFSTNGSNIGQIGELPGQSLVTPVTYDRTQSGYVVHNAQGAPAGATGGGYTLTTKSCSSGDSGNVCLALGNSTACKQPITMTPFALTFPPQLLGAATTSQTITLTNNSASQLTGLTLSLVELDSRIFYSSGSDFNGLPSFTEQDNCTQAGTVSLDAGKSCTITVSFSPQESCTWLPQTVFGGVAPASCPAPIKANLVVTVPSGSVDADNEFVVPLTGTGLSAVVPSTAELDLGAQAIGEASPPQTLTFTNQSPKPVTIAPSAGPCVYSSAFVGTEQPRPPFAANGTPQIGGLPLAETANIGLTNSQPIQFPQPFVLSPPLINAPTVQYFCDTDLPKTLGGSGEPNFKISNDTCSGQTLHPFGQPGNSCSLKVTFVPQPGTWSHLTFGTTLVIGLDDFLQFNSAWCGDATNPAEPNCEVDSGRFPVEIKTNPPSPLRMTPAAALEFGSVIKGTASAPLTLTLFNDPVDPNSAPVTFTSKLVKGDYLETDNCPPTLAPNQSCEFTVTFTPNVVGSDQGQITITYSTPTAAAAVQTIYLRGIGQ